MPYSPHDLPDALPSPDSSPWGTSRDKWPESHPPPSGGSEQKPAQTSGHGKPRAKEKPPPSWGAPIPASQLRLPTRRPWLWEGYLAPGSITLLSALWKAGKTTLLAHLLKTLEMGGSFCGKAVAPSRVLYVTEEAEGRWAKRRDQLILADNVSFFVRPFRGRPDWSDWSAFTLHLADCVKANPVELIVFDPLVNLWPVRDENDNAQVLSALLPLYNVADLAALLLAHHVRKGDGQEATASRGAGALTGFVDTIVELRRFHPSDRKDCRRVLTAYGRDEETPDELVIELTDAGYVAQGDRGEASMIDLLPTIAGILPSEPPGWTRNQVSDKWPEDARCARPGADRLLDALHRGARMGTWIEEGQGIRGSPYRFHRPLD